MVLTKVEVDRSVENILSKAKNDSEKHLALLRISKLYFQAGDLESSKKYCLSCLSSKETAVGFKQLGNILEGQGKKEEALGNYIRSFGLDGTQKDIILKVVEILNQLPLDREKCQIWLEKAEPLYSRNVAVRSLKDRLSTATTGSAQMEKNLKDEISKRPFEASLRVRLLKFYMDNGSYDKAYEYARVIEDTSTFHEELDWYQALDELGSLMPTKLPSLVNIDYHVFHLFVVERLCALTIASKRSVVANDALVQADISVLQILQRLDRYLHNLVHTYRTERSESWQAFINNMKGQLYFHMLSVLLLRMRGHLNNTRENRSFVNTLLLAAFNIAPVDARANWMEKDARRKLCERWRLQACDRLAVAGHMILAHSRGNKDRYMESVAFDEKEQIFQSVFHHSSSDSESFFLKESHFESTGDAFPDLDMLRTFEKGSQLLAPVNFQKFVWFATRYKDIAGENGAGALATNFELYLFDDMNILPFSSPNVKSTAPDTVCQLDAYTFIYATVLCGANNLVDSSAQLPLSPPYLATPLHTAAQAQWWESLIRLVKNEAKDKIGEYRRILQRGIETVRLVGAHRISTALVVKLAHILTKKAVNYEDGIVHISADPFQLPSHSNEESAAIAARAALYWQHFIASGLEADTISSALYRGEKLFDYPGVLWTSSDEAKCRDEAILFLGMEALKAGKLKEALSYFDDSRRPEASFYSGLIYRKWALDDLNGARPERASPDTLSGYYALLEKARDAFHLTLDRLRQPSVGQGHELNKVIAEVIEDVDDRLSKADVGPSESKNSLVKKNSEDSMFFSTPKSSVTQTPMKIQRQLQTPGSIAPIAKHVTSILSEARPSPERLDGQIRALSTAHDLAVQTTMEQYRLILGELKEIRSSVGEVKDLKVAFREKISQVEDHLKDITKQISDLSIKVARRSRSRRQSESIVNEEDLYEYDDYVEQYDEDENFEAIGAAPRRKPRPPQQRQTPQLVPAQPFPYPGLGAQQMFCPPNMLNLLQDQNLQNQLAFGYGGFPGALPWLQHQQQLQLGLAGLQGPPLSQPLAQPPVQIPPVQAPQPQPQLPVPPVQTTSQAAPPKSDLLSSLLNKPVESKMPQNVVISTSVTLPTTTAAAPALPAVTVPPQHRLGMVTPQKQANSYQIPLPDSAKLITSSPLDGKETTPVKPPAGFLSSVPEPKFSSVTKTPDQQKTPLRDRNASIGSEASYVEEEHDAMPDFKPIIPLPEEVEVKTGEEEEEVLFNERAKLFRFVDKEWKERGVGQMKILKHPETGKVRIVMRREQVLKVCANHPITSDLKITYMPKSDNALCWGTPDYSESEMTVEKFSVRFKAAEQAKNFKEIFETAAKSAKEKPQEKAEGKPAKPEEKPAKVEDKGFGDKFKISGDQWECKVCYVRNKVDQTKCMSCSTPKPGAAPAETKAPSTTAPATQPTASPFLFGVKPAPSGAGPAVAEQKPSGFAFGTQAATAPAAQGTTTAFMFGTISAAPAATAEKQTGKPAMTFSFGMPATAPAKPTEPVKPAETKPTFTFSVPTTQATAPAKPVEIKPPTFTFGALSGKPAEPAKAEDLSKKLETGLPKPVFSASVKPAEPTKPVFGLGTTANGSFSFGPVSSAATAQTTTAQTKLFNPPKFTFGGLLQTVETEPATVAKKEEPAKPNIFAAFTFGTAKAEEKPAASIKPEEKKPEESVSLSSILQQKGDDAASTGMLFSSLATGATSGFKKSDDFKGFPGQGAPVFGAGKKETPAVAPTTVAGATPKKEEGKPSGEEEGAEEFVPTAEFKPVVPLPDLVEVKTGEEDETPLFSERGILYRFDPSTKEWKEKGRGDFKVLKHKKTGKVRFLMRREQVLKICCNHLLTGLIDLKPMNDSDRAFIWFAQDYSEAEMKEEKLALRFKYAETAQKFKEIVDQAKKDLLTQPATSESPAEEKPAEAVKAAEIPKADNWDKFKPQTGSWECPGCLCRNPADTTQCPACSTLKPGSVITTGKFRFDSQPPQSAFKFGVTPITTAAASTTASTATTTTPATTGFSFTSPTASKGTGFTFQLKPTDSVTSPVKSRSANVSRSSENEFYEDDGHGDELHFEPVVPLPEKVEVKTGEEDELVYFRHRAKLFRMATTENGSEWKERGLGDIKVLRHKVTGKCRLLMRREHVHKLCLNHTFVPEIKFMQTSDRKSVMWAARDFSELRETPEGTVEKFLLRFKTPDLLQEFLDALKKALDGVEPPKDLQEQNQEKEIEVVFVRKPTEEEKRRAAELELPENFFSYEQKRPCPGCIGCKDEDLPSLFGTTERTERTAAEKYEGEHGDDEEYEDVQETLVMESFATMSRKAEGENRWALRGVGMMKIIYDDDLYCYRVTMHDEADEKIPLLDVVITSDCESSVQDTEIHWEGYDTSDDPDHPVRYTFRAKFTTHDDALQFQHFFEEGRDMAEKAGFDTEHYLSGDYEDVEDED